LEIKFRGTRDLKRAIFQNLKRSTFVSEDLVKEFRFKESLRQKRIGEKPVEANTSGIGHVSRKGVVRKTGS
jgi:hypothetical protein